MTKERKKALAEKTVLVLIECDFNASKELAVVTKLIEIVAAEAREEGIEEAVEIALPCLIESENIKKIFTLEIKRLKEKVK